nr:protein-export chaperone SecB [Phaeovibrio sulfidiphilus]
MPPLVINGQYTKDLSFESPNSPVIFTRMAAPPEVKLDLHVEAERIGENAYEVVLLIQAEARTPEMTAFMVELKYAAVCSVNLPEEHVKPATLIEVPRMIFPFARNIIADVTRDGGFPPLLVQPPDFAGLFRKMQLADQPSKGSA